MENEREEETDVEDQDIVDGPSTPKKRRQQRGSDFHKAEKPKHRAQKYRKAWESESEFKGWLFPCADDDTKARCSYCNAVFTAEKSVLKLHGKSKGHVKKFVPSVDKDNRRQASVPTLFKQITELTPLKVQAKDAEIKFATFFAEHNIPFNAADHLDELLKTCFPDSKIAQEFTLKRKKVRGIISNVIGQSHKEEIARDLKKNKFAMIIDESTDISGKKAMCVVVRYYIAEKDKVASRFWDLHQLYTNDNEKQIETGATAASLYDGVLASFTAFGIPLRTNLVAFAADGASVMMGISNSFASRLRADFPGIFILKCICHSVHLCASEACKALPSRCEELARAVYNFFRFSAKRTAQLVAFQTLLNLDPHAMLHPSQTRWLSLLAVVLRLLEQWDALLLYFTGVSLSEVLLTASQILEWLRDPFIKMYFYFLQWVLPKFIELNKHFQSSKVVIIDLHKKVETLYKDLLLAYMERRYVVGTPVDRINPTNRDKYLPDAQLYLACNVASQLLHKDVKDCQERKAEFFHRCRQFLITGAIELQKRWDFTNPVLTHIQSMSPSLVLSNPHRDAVPSILPLADSLPRVRPDSMVLQAIDDQWRRIPLAELPPEIKDETEADVFWSRLLRWKDSCDVEAFQELAQFALDALILPHANVDCERIFSKVNLCKTKVRNKLVVPTVNGLLLASECAKSSTCVKFVPTDDMRRRMTAANFYAPVEKPANVFSSTTATWSSAAATSEPLDPDDPDDLLDEAVFF